MALSNKDFDLTAQWINDEYHRRKSNRRDRERLWREIDRQLAMIPRPREVKSGEKKDWFPDIEPPFQFNALEVIAADARRLKFPRGTEWFMVSAEVSDDYIRRFQSRRDKFPMIGDTPVPMDLDQETANLFVKTTIDHFHRIYDFREKIDSFDNEMIKYGSGAVRVRPVQLAKFDSYRGARGKVIGPAVIPCSIKNTYLDDSPSAILHEGLLTSPGHIRTGTQLLDDMKRASKVGGQNKGWRPGVVSQLKPTGNGKVVEIMEFEGDAVIPKSQGSLFFPNVIITVAKGSGDPKIVRFEESPVPFNSYVIGHYMRDDVTSPYGSSPLMKGQPVQEAISEILNDLLAAARLNADPSIAYDGMDTKLAASGGPEVFPGAVFPTDSPNALEVLKVGDVAALTNAYLAFVKQYEDLTGANDPRRGSAQKSHTTAEGNVLEASRGIARTDDFATAVEQGPLTAILNMEFDVIKHVMTQPQSISVGKSGIDGWVRLAAQDLADNVSFFVQGSAGVASERERRTNFADAANFATGLAQAAAALGQPFEVKFVELATEAFEIAGINQPSRFIGPSSGVPGGPQGAADVSRLGAQPAANSGAPVLAS